jgi:hypothetical protein
MRLSTQVPLQTEGRTLPAASRSTEELGSGYEELTRNQLAEECGWQVNAEKFL